MEAHMEKLLKSLNLTEEDVIAVVDYPRDYTAICAQMVVRATYPQYYDDCFVVFKDGDTFKILIYKNRERITVQFSLIDASDNEFRRPVYPCFPGDSSPWTQDAIERAIMTVEARYIEGLVQLQQDIASQLLEILKAGPANLVGEVQEDLRDVYYVV